MNAPTYPTAPQPPSSVQPGGGWCVHIEKAWGALRRLFLRVFRPAYVRRCLQQRQGQCERCPHQVIDWRDLKYVRSVCDFSFPGQPHPGRPFLGLARYGLCEVVVFSLLLLLPIAALSIMALDLHWTFWIPAAGLALVWLEIVFFFRDPRRDIPQDVDALVSPADGTITNIEEVHEIDFPGPALRISIFLSIFNVHVNRMAWSAQVKQVRYFPGDYLDARNPDSAVRNEQLWIDAVDTAGMPLRLKQISGAIARRIVCWLRPGDALIKGERIGMIKLGSRTDLIVPAERVREVAVKVGVKVKGGSTVLLRLHSPFRARPPMASPS